MTVSLKTPQPDFELFMDISVAHRPIRHKIGVGWKSLDDGGLTLHIDDLSTLIIVLPVVKSTESYVDTEVNS